MLVVWASSYKVGCAVVVCPKLGGKKNIAILVCNYGPPGNYQGVRPYKTGTPCSECPKGDTCQNNQCRNPEREKENSHRYSGWYPPFETWTTCDAACIAAVVLRLLLMLLAFVAVYFLKIRYPGLNSQK